VTGHIQKRGARNWRIKFEVDRDPVTGKRKAQYVTVAGTKKQAAAELTRLVAARDAGTMIVPAKLTVTDYMRLWLSTAEAMSISPKTAERYRQLIECQIVPHLGALPLQRIRGAHVAERQAKLLREGGHDGRPLSPRTVGHAHRVLHKALA
jgi:integrase